jgi:hypothetical protein
MISENQRNDVLIMKIETLQDDVSFIREKIVLVEKHEKVLYGSPEMAAEGKCGLINQVVGQGRKLDGIQRFIYRAGAVINIVITAIITGLVNLVMHKTKS